MKNAIIAIILAVCTASASAQQVFYSWTADVDAPTPNEIIIMSGETIGLSASLVQSGDPLIPASGSTAAMFWQTNGMSSMWWEAPATLRSNVISAVWTPTNDCGASLYTAFLGASGPSGSIYRASARIHIRHAPGASPNALPLPVSFLDFSSLATTNAPWLSTDTWYSYSNDIYSAVSAESETRYSADEIRTTYQATTNIATYVVAEDASSAYSNAVASADSWLVVSNGTLAVWSVTNSATNVATRLWASSESAGGAPDAAATNAIWTAIRYLTAALPDGAQYWSSYDANGNTNPDSEITLLNRASTIIGAGLRIETSGTYGVLVADGTVAFLSSTNGSMRIGPDSTNTFGYVQGGTVVVGANSGSFSYDAENNSASITYSYNGSGDYPTIYYTASLSAPVWSEVSGCVWTYQTGSTTATVVVPAAEDAGFYKATTSSTSANYFYSAMPAVFQGGVFGSRSDLPIIYDSTINITSGGHTYRIPAELVQ